MLNNEVAKFVMKKNAPKRMIEKDVFLSIEFYAKKDYMLTVKNILNYISENDSGMYSIRYYENEKSNCTKVEIYYHFRISKSNSYKQMYKIGKEVISTYSIIQKNVSMKYSVSLSLLGTFNVDLRDSDLENLKILGYNYSMDYSYTKERGEFEYEIKKYTNITSFSARVHNFSKMGIVDAYYKISNEFLSDAKLLKIKREHN